MKGSKEGGQSPQERSKEGGQRPQKRGREGASGVPDSGSRMTAPGWPEAGTESSASELPAAGSDKVLPCPGRPAGAATREFPPGLSPALALALAPQACRTPGEAGDLPAEARNRARRGLVGEAAQTNKLHRGLVPSPPITLLSTAVYFEFHSLFTLLFGTEPPEHANTIFV